ncbi:class I SAM-dependent methyltransferase [Actinoplanes rectilineatus]|uniref:class I SAM-dependent methyltransferase n=1 Tax=Actinoplanes rectilineatus TaxID=113571 RepID=UPI00147025A5|nr:class I SAM-dependent methyltransferase [Actinoplanes rectilineatus]
MSGYVLSRYHAKRRELASGLLARSLASMPTGPLLEIGSSAESLIPSLSGRQVITSDISLGALYEAKAAGVCLNAANGLPFRDASVAAVVSGELIEHIFDVRAMVEEFRRVIKPGGVLVLTTPNLATLQDRLRFLTGASPRQVDPLHPYLHLHIRPFTASALRRLLRTCGFEVTALRSNFVGWEWNGHWLEWRWPARLVPGIGGSLIVAARRR